MFRFILHVIIIIIILIVVAGFVVSFLIEKEKVIDVGNQPSDAGKPLLLKHKRHAWQIDGVATTARMFTKMLQHIADVCSLEMIFLHLTLQLVLLSLW